MACKTHGYDENKCLMNASNTCYYKTDVADLKNYSRQRIKTKIDHSIRNDPTSFGDRSYITPSNDRR